MEKSEVVSLVLWEVISVTGAGRESISEIGILRTFLTRVDVLYTFFLATDWLSAFRKSFALLSFAWPSRKVKNRSSTHENSRVALVTVVGGV